MGVRPARTRLHGTSRRRRSRGSRPGADTTPTRTTWELYYLPDDFSQAKDIAADHPDKLAELQELFWQEAERNRALPLLGGSAAFFGILPPMPTVTRFTFAGDVQNIQTDAAAAHLRPVVRDRGGARRCRRAAPRA